jgi:hypothetical protein
VYCTIWPRSILKRLLRKTNFLPFSLLFLRFTRTTNLKGTFATVPISTHPTLHYRYGLCWLSVFLFLIYSSGTAWLFVNKVRLDSTRYLGNSYSNILLTEKFQHRGFSLLYIDISLHCNSLHIISLHWHFAIIYNRVGWILAFFTFSTSVPLRVVVYL